MRFLALVAASFAVLILASGPAQAQNAGLSLTPQATSLSFGPNETRTLVWTVRNTGPLDGTVTLNLPPVRGWDLQLQEAAPFTLAAGAGRDVKVDVQARAASPNSSIVLAATIRDAIGRTVDQKSETRVVFVAPPAPPAVPPPPASPWRIWVAIIGGVFLGLYAFQATAVRLDVSSDRLDVTPAGTGYVRVTLRNRYWPVRTVHVRVQKMPAPAVAALSLGRVRLRRGEPVSVPVLVKAPVEMPDGPRIMTLQARAGRFSPWTAQRRVSLEFRNPTPITDAVEPPQAVFAPDDMAS
jgi:hypothetical protein